MNFIHDKANVEGDVKLGGNVSVWASASIRGDEGKITIGDNSNVQDNVTIHGAVSVGQNVTIGHGAVVHGAKIGDNILIGMNSTILDGAEIGDWCVIAAGSLVTPDTKIKTGSLIMGSPGKVVRKIEEKDRVLIISSYKNYLKKMSKLD